MDDFDLPSQQQQPPPSYSSATQQRPTSAPAPTAAVGVAISLDNPHVDKIINSGTTAANCQPKHTRENLSAVSSDDGLSSNLSADSSVLSASSRASRQQRKMEQRALKKAQKEEKKLRKQQEKQKLKEEKEMQQQNMDPKKMGYIQMAKMGYQELVNAIIRPPRADYKV